MTSSVFTPPVPSELDDEVDDAQLPVGQRWAYPCKLPSCPDYGKSWLLRSNFLLHLQESEAHGSSAATPAIRRAIELLWRYATDPHLPPRAAPDFRSREEPDEWVLDYSFRDDRGKMIAGRGTHRQMEMHKERHNLMLQMQGTPDA
ncbi:hypothetical protein CONLIGDRAFT_637718 [Coniochaeta ligniaria NRRL 30616]|uniref:C2H2-type domain-containing protein n=1 Tax=Coniochaeta ligniaria NRRL 30616 TaxID=1408157 RepID=A0A1J7I769_9PEZI|nr:hypothetical protein CONLIGDRAFT_637718 [Coniochaeta ligniaria NRRL 30616]